MVIEIVCEINGARMILGVEMMLWPGVTPASTPLAEIGVITGASTEDAGVGTGIWLEAVLSV